MNYILFDGPFRNALLPFTYTRPVADIRVGILTIREKWEMVLGSTTTTITEDYLVSKFPMVEMEENTLINASYTPNEDLVEMIQNLKPKQVIFDGETVVPLEQQKPKRILILVLLKSLNCPESVLAIKNTWSIFQLNGVAIESDFQLITKTERLNPFQKKRLLLTKHKFLLKKVQRYHIVF